MIGLIGALLYGAMVEEETKERAKPKHGRWIKISERNYKCSVCEDWWAGDEEEIKTLKYCPNCGAKISSEVK